MKRNPIVDPGWKLDAGTDARKVLARTCANPATTRLRSQSVSSIFLIYSYLPLSCSFAIQSLMYWEQWSSDTPSF